VQHGRGLPQRVKTRLLWYGDVSATVRADGFLRESILSLTWRQCNLLP